MSKRINHDDIERFHDYGLHLPTRTILLGSETYDMEEGESGVDGKLAEKAIKNLHILDTISKEPIAIIMNNPGGDKYHGMAIYDAIQECKSHVTIKVKGMAMSMGSIILQAGDLRVLSPHACVMIHYGTWGAADVPKTMYAWAEEGKKFDSIMERLYLAKIREKHPNFTLKKIQELLNFDTILSAKDAIALGLADSISGQDEET